MKTAVEWLVEEIKIKADNLSTNTKENRIAKGVYVDCLLMARKAKEIDKQQQAYSEEEGKVELRKKVQISNSDLSLGSYTTTNSSYFGNPVLNGLTCPKCQSELLDSQPRAILTSDPAQKRTKCSNDKCDYQGYRFI